MVVLFVLQKPLFMLLTHASAAQPLENPFSTMLAVIWHGLQLDLSMAGYLTAIPALLLLASIWIKEEIIRPVFSIYFGIIAVFMSFCFVLNIALYPYWNFPLDSTPLFYFFTSPADAFASTSIWVDLLGFICLILCAAAIWFVLSLTIREKKSADMVLIADHIVHQVILTDTVGALPSSCCCLQACYSFLSEEA